ncbi:hypothetical protein R1flu_020273 [Riccia fluitans]|uniref:Uncharacterized protein n=1 Tax=Riccia fluitans TaxID=41844 RepID=A0ABD1ZMI0_9MARC
MRQECFGDRMDKAKLEELRRLKKYIKPCSELRIGSDELIDHYGQVLMDVESAKVDMKFVVADLAVHLANLQEKLIGELEGPK